MSKPNQSAPKIDWRGDPQALVGKKIQVLWAKGKRYIGYAVAQRIIESILTVVAT